MKLFLIIILVCFNFGFSTIVFSDRQSAEEVVAESISKRSYEFGISYSPLCCGNYFDPAMGSKQFAGAINSHFLALRKHGFRYSFSFENYKLNQNDIPEYAKSWEVTAYEHSFEYFYRWARGFHSNFELGFNLVFLR